MKTFRLYTGSDGQSHVEPIDLARTPGWTKGLATTQIAFSPAVGVSPSSPA